MTDHPAEFAGGRLLPTVCGAQLVAAALRRATLRDGIGYRARPAAGEAQALLAMPERLQSGAARTHWPWTGRHLASLPLSASARTLVTMTVDWSLYGPR